MSGNRLQLQSDLMRVRTEMLVHMSRDEGDTDFCGRCHLPLPTDEYEAYEFCPWCDQSICGQRPHPEQSRRIVEHEWGTSDDIQCGECGCEYTQPNRYPFLFCPHCGAQFDDENELLIELPFQV